MTKSLVYQNGGGCMKIGPRLKQLRVKQNLTLEELASRSELTKGFLSQVERDLTSPSISTLEDILEALGTTLADFFKESKDEQIVFKENDYFVDEQEDYKISWIVPNAQKNKMEPILLEIQPQSQSKEIVPHDGEEFGYILSGRVTLVFGKRSIILKKGETFYIKGDENHYIKNDGTSTAKIIWVTTPPIF